MSPSRLPALALLAATVAAQLSDISALHLISGPALVCIWPGVAAARWLGVPLDWRDARAQCIVLTSSLALTPLVVFFASAIVPFSTTTAALALGMATALALLAPPPATAARDRLPLSRQFVFLSMLVILAVAMALAPLRNDYRDSILPLQSVVELTDWPKHYALVWEIEQSGVPPRNLLFLQNPPVPHVYHIFFHLTIALLDLFSAQWLGIMNWLVGGAMLAAYAVLVSVYAATRVLWSNERAALISTAAVPLLGGLDALPNAAAIVRGASEPLVRHIDGWSGCQSEISNFYTVFTWVPQHAVSLSIALCAWLVFSGGPRQRWRAPLLIALGLAASLGHSIYVPLGVGLGIACFAVGQVARLARARTGWGAVAAAAPWCGAALVGMVALAPLAVYLFSAPATGNSAPFALSVHSSGLRGTGFAPAAPFQFIAPQAGVIAQLLDLPLYWLFELGAVLPLALLGLLASGGDRHSDTWRLGFIVAATSLLLSTFVRSTLGCNDLGLRAGLPFQAWLAIMAGGGWLALRGAVPVAAGARPAGLRAPNLLPTVALVLLVAVAALLAYQLPMPYRYDLLTDRFAPVSGLYEPETLDGQRYRWTQPEVHITFNDIAQNTDYRLEVRARSGTRPANAPPAYTLARVNGQLVGSFTATPNPGTLTLELPRDLVWSNPTLRVDLFVVPYQPSRFGLGDRRELGLLMDEISLVPSATNGLVLPPWVVLIAGVFIALMVAVQTGSRAVRATLPFLFAGGLTVAREPVVTALQYVALILILLWSARRGAPLLAAWARRRLADPRSRLLQALIMSLMVIGVLTVGWIFLSYNVSRFLPPFDAAAATRDAVGTAYAGAVRTVRSGAPPGAIIQLDPRLGGHMPWGLAMERRNYFVFDEVFAYQFTPLSRAARLERVITAYEMPTLPEACDQFRRLGITFVVVEPQARHYPWLLDVHEPDACLRPVYESGLVAVLALQP